MKLDHQKFIDLYKAQYSALDGSQASGISTLLDFLDHDKDVSDLRWAAYTLATVKLECADAWQGAGEALWEPAHGHGQRKYLRRRSRNQTG